MPTNIEPAKKFDAVPLIEVGDEVKGGLEGAANKQAIALANRTQYLKEELEQIPAKIDEEISELKGAPDPFPQYLSQDKANDLYLKLEGANLPSGPVTLDANGKIPTEFLNFVKTTYKVVADKTARLALTASADLQIVVQQDEDRLYYLNGNADPSVDTNWFKGQSATVNGVSSVFGRTGQITAEAGDYTADQITETPNRGFVSSAERQSWTQKQATLVSGANIVTVFGKTLLGSGNLSLTPAEMGAADASHKHPVSDVTDLDKYVQSTVNNAFEPGSGVSMGVNPRTNKLTLSVNPTSVDAPGYVTVDRVGSVAGQIHDFAFTRTSRWSLDAFAMKRIPGATNQISRFDSFSSGLFTDYTLSSRLNKTTSLGATLIRQLATSKDGDAYKAETVTLNDLINAQFDAGAATASVVPLMTANNLPSGYVASASGERNLGGNQSEAAFRAFDGGVEDWFTTGSNGQWIRIDLPNATKISSYSFKTRPEGITSLASWYLQGSNDNGATWTNLHTGSNSVVTADTTLTFNIAAQSQNAYKSYRIYVLSSNGGSYASLSQWKLFPPAGRMLLKGNDGNWYKSATGVLSQVPAPTSSSDFDSNGFINSGSIPAAQWGALTSLTPYSYSAALPTFSIIPNPQIAIPLTRRNASMFGAITNITPNVASAGGTVLSIALSKDNSEFFVYKNSAWVSIGVLKSDVASATVLANQGNTPAELSAVTQAQLNDFFGGDYSTLGIAYGLKYTAITDTGQYNYLQLTGNLVDTWQFQSPTEVTINRRADGITFKTVNAGDYKICYQIP